MATVDHRRGIRKEEKNWSGASSLKIFFFFEIRSGADRDTEEIPRPVVCYTSFALSRSLARRGSVEWTLLRR